MTEEQYNKKKWELYHAWRAIPRAFPKVAIARKRRLILHVAEYHGTSFEEARQKVNDMDEISNLQIVTQTKQRTK